MAAVTVTLRTWLWGLTECGSEHIHRPSWFKVRERKWSTPRKKNNEKAIKSPPLPTLSLVPCFRRDKCFCKSLAGQSKDGWQVPKQKQREAVNLAISQKKTQTWWVGEMTEECLSHGKLLKKVKFPEKFRETQPHSTQSWDLSRLPLSVPFPF